MVVVEEAAVGGAPTLFYGMFGGLVQRRKNKGTHQVDVCQSVFQDRQTDRQTGSPEHVASAAYMVSGGG